MILYSFKMFLCCHYVCVCCCMLCEYGFLMRVHGCLLFCVVVLRAVLCLLCVYGVLMVWYVVSMLLCVCAWKCVKVVWVVVISMRAHGVLMMVYC